VALLALALAGCGPSRVDVKGSFPEPLMDPLPVNLGVWYSPDFSTHEFSDAGENRGESGWVVKTGEAQTQMWDTLLNGMFSELTHLDSEPGSDADAAPVDAVLIPAVDELQYTIPTHTNVKVYEVWLRYRFKLVEPDGDTIADWTMTSYGKTPTAFMRSNTAAVNLAAVVALRDAGANFATKFVRIPEIEQWLEQHWQMDSPKAATDTAGVEETP